jgi:hypothetical protein
MNRRELLAAVACLLAAPLTGLAAEDACAVECGKCLKTCQTCVAECLKEDGREACIRLCLD